jgi:hypothetical protein
MFVTFPPRKRSSRHFRSYEFSALNKETVTNVRNVFSRFPSFLETGFPLSCARDVSRRAVQLNSITSNQNLKQTGESYFRPYSQLNHQE